MLSDPTQQNLWNDFYDLISMRLQITQCSSLISMKLADLYVLATNFISMIWLIISSECCFRFITLKPGDLILTGTPPGVGCFRKPPEYLKVSILEPDHKETNKMIQRPMITSEVPDQPWNLHSPISLREFPVCVSTHKMHSEDLAQSGRMVILLVLIYSYVCHGAEHLPT